MRLLVLAVLAVLLSAFPARLPRAAPPVATLDDYATERALRTTAPPPRDLYALFARLGGAADRIERVAGSTSGWRTGTTERFWVADLSANEYTQRGATLRYVSDNAYWFVEDGRDVGGDALRDAAERFDAVAERNRATFGSEWRPGVDGDPRIVVLIASTPGAGGYYSSADEYPRSINPYSNQHEMIYVDAQPGDPYFDATLAHEFQHMIHWNEHASQDVWLNEGMSEYAVELNGYDIGLPEGEYAAAPDTQLNTWADTPAEAGEHYGQSYRFMSYLGGRFGSEIMVDIIRDRGTGLDAVDAALRARGTDLDAVYAEWLAANALAGGEAGGPMRYAESMTPVASAAARLGEVVDASVRQWGADYYALDTNAAFTVSLEADARVPLVGNAPREGVFQWYSNRGDLMDSHLTRTLDLSGVRDATLELDLWYDIEEHFDYAYVAVSTDGGRRWRTLAGRRTTNENPNGNNLGNGLTGRSGGWVTERFDLGPYAGREIRLRIEYVTDDGYNAQGIAVDGVRVPEIGFSDDSESPNGWTSVGWIRTNNYLPGRYRLLVVDPDGGGVVREVSVGADGRATATFENGSGEPPVIVVGGAAQTTTQESAYTLRLEAAEAGGLAVTGGRAP